MLSWLFGVFQRGSELPIASGASEKEERVLLLQTCEQVEPNASSIAKENALCPGSIAGCIADSCGHNLRASQVES